MDVKAMRYFLAVAETGNITKAARALYLTQPALSRQIKELEAELGCNLLTRHSHRVTLTRDGVKFRMRAQTIVDLTDQALRDFQKSKHGSFGSIAIGAGESNVMLTIANVVAQLQRQHPEVIVHLRTGYDTNIANWLERGIIDFGIVFTPANVSKYHHLSIPSNNRYGLVVRKDSPLASKSGITPDDVKDIPLIVSRQATRRSVTSNPFNDWFGYDIDELDIRATMDLPTNATFFVREGIGSLFTFEGLTDLSPEANLAFVPLEPEISALTDICWLKSRPLSPAAELFLEILKSSAESLAAK